MYRMKFDLDDPEFPRIISIPFGFISMIKGVFVGYSLWGIGGSIVVGIIFFLLGSMAGIMLFNLVMIIGSIFLIPIVHAPRGFVAFLFVLLLIFFLWGVKF